MPEILRLQHMEHVERMRQMNMKPVRLQLGLVRDNVIVFQTVPTGENSCSAWVASI